jgi:chemotaxis methyl-accepting protein methylase
LQERYLDRAGEHFNICESVRRRVLFARRDVTAMSAQEAPCGGYDLICCRNVLIYFDREVQMRTLSTLCGYLRPGGFLCLGEAEWPPAPMSTMLQALPHKTRVFRLHRGFAQWP